MIKLKTPLLKEEILKLKAGDSVLLSGIIYTGRDAAHKRLYNLIKSGENLPINLKDQVIYYVGPSPTKPGEIIGSAGPTTSYRMDDYTPDMLDLGLKGMIGKGKRSKEVIDSIVKNKCVYFGAIGGAAALISKAIRKCDIVAYEDLGTEAIRRLEIEDMPLTVIVDSNGNNIYEIGRKTYLESIK